MRNAIILQSFPSNTCHLNLLLMIVEGSFEIWPSLLQGLIFIFLLFFLFFCILGENWRARLCCIGAFHNHHLVVKRGRSWNLWVNFDNKTCTCLERTISFWRRKPPIVVYIYDLFGGVFLRVLICWSLLPLCFWPASLHHLGAPLSPPPPDFRIKIVIILTIHSLHVALFLSKLLV